MNKFLISFVFLFLIILQNPLKAQYGYTTIGFQAGIANYFGDLNPLASYLSTEIRFTRPSFGLNIARTFGAYNRFSARLGVCYARLQGDDFTAANPNDERHRYRYVRNAHFRNDIYEGSLTFTMDILSGERRKSPISPYIFAGVAGFYHNPQAKTPASFGGGWVDLQPLHTEGQGKEGYKKPYSLFQFAIPFGAGVRLRLTDRWDLGVEMGIRYTFTDYLDDVSTTYANPADLDGPLSIAMANRTTETIETLNGNSRVAEITRLAGILGTSTFVTPDGRVLDTFNGYGQKGDKRGNPLNDVYVFTAFTINYVINPRPYCPTLNDRNRNKRGSRFGGR